MNDFADLRSILPEAIQEELRKMEHQEKHNGHDGKGKIVRIRLEKKNRKGKTVTVISGFQHNPQTMEEIAKILKEYCGAGGTVKSLEIEIQGDQRKKTAEKLGAMNYIVKG
ncbi:MAG: translation initiation factor [Bacteroidota bacterium]